MTFAILVTIGWMYVAVMMAVVEATSSTGSVLGALVTFVLYGVLPLAIVLYLLTAPARGRARHAARRTRSAGGADEDSATPNGTADAGVDPDQRGHAAGDTVAPIRKKS